MIIALIILINTVLVVTLVTPGVSRTPAVAGCSYVKTLLMDYQILVGLCKYSHLVYLGPGDKQDNDSQSNPSVVVHNRP